MPLVEVFRSHRQPSCEQRAFVLHAVGIPSEVLPYDSAYLLFVDADSAATARDHIERYNAENVAVEKPKQLPTLHGHAWITPTLYAMVLVGIGYCAARNLLGLDWFDIGALRSDVQRSGARFVNRTLGTGTRVILDELLAQAGLAAAGIKGYDTVEPSHTAAALAVASGTADVALGIAIAAQSQGLDFVPLVQENYHLVCLKTALQEPAVKALLDLLQGADWQSCMQGIAGYAPHQCGQVLSLSDVLPWWKFAKEKSRKN